MVCLATWFVIEHTRLGGYLRAATENPLVRAFGINVPRMITLTYGAGVALAALAGVMAAPIYPGQPADGRNFIIVVFAVVVIGGMGSIMGAIVTGFGLGLVEGLTRCSIPRPRPPSIFVIMAIVLLVRPAGLFGPKKQKPHGRTAPQPSPPTPRPPACVDPRALLAFAIMALIHRRPAGRRLPGVLMKVMCFALFACAFNLLLGLSAAAVLRPCHVPGRRRLASAHAAKVWGLTPRAGHCLRHPVRHAPSWAGPAGHPPPGHLLRHDHAGAGADGVLLQLQAPSPAARTASRRCRAATCSAWIDLSRPGGAMYRRVLAIFPGPAFRC